MNKTLSLILLAAAALLSACGGGYKSDTKSNAPSASYAATVHGGGAAVSTRNSDYYDATQRIYVGYFGRPSDPAGLDYWAGQLVAAGAPTDFQGMIAAYGKNASLSAIIDTFATSAESQALYPGDNAAFLTAIYHNLFSRDPDAAGLAYWKDLVDRGALTRTAAALTLMAGAQGSDVTIINNKVTAAAQFNNALDTAAKLSAYSGLSANAIARAMLFAITDQTDPTTYASRISAALSQMAPAVDTTALRTQAMAIIKSRCAGCHSQHPTIPGFNPAPLGIWLDNVDQVRSYADQIRAVAVDGQLMPYANMTNMTQAERDTLGQWLGLGAP